MSKHTPGPWKAQDNSWEVSTVYSAAGEVARCYIDSNVTEDTQDNLEQIKEANARLIAAAPDLLEAAKQMQGWIEVLLKIMDMDLDGFEMELSNSKTGQSTTIILKDQFLKASAAIAKAEGSPDAQPR